MIVAKIVSGGQTGADFAGLLAGKTLGIPTGGWAPRGWLIETDDGHDHHPAPWLADYGLKECLMPMGEIPVNDGSRRWWDFCTKAYSVRTRENAGASSGSIWFGSGDSTGYNKTKRSCIEFDRPFFPVFEGITTPNNVRDWIERHEVKTLNTAGNRLSKQPTRPGETPFVDRVVRFLVATLKGPDHAE